MQSLSCELISRLFTASFPFWTSMAMLMDTSWNSVYSFSSYSNVLRHLRVFCAVYFSETMSEIHAALREHWFENTAHLYFPYFGEFIQWELTAQQLNDSLYSVTVLGLVNVSYSTHTQKYFTYFIFLFKNFFFLLFIIFIQHWMQLKILLKWQTSSIINPLI